MRFAALIPVTVALSVSALACTANSTDSSPKDEDHTLFGTGTPAAPPSSTDDPQPGTSTSTQPAPSTGGTAPAPQPGMAPGTDSQTPPPPPPATIDPSASTHPEVVYVLMAGKDGNTWFCTGTLIAPTVALTAAHCLQTAMFKSWTVVAPLAANAPRVTASSVLMYDPNWNDVAHPDIGIVKLSAPIQLAGYAALTDITAQVDAGQPTSVAAVLRKEAKPESLLEKTGVMSPLTSTVQYGYTHGYGLPMFSKGGDSGAGVFLIENGQMTHKVVAVERTPEPSRNLDHLSRVESAFIQWVTANGGP